MLSLRALASRSVKVGRASQCPPTLLSRRQTRQFSVSPRRQATPSPDELMSTLRHTKLFKEIQANQELREALMDAVKALQEEGFDMQKPSMMMLLTNAKVRETVGRVTKAVEAAGLDMATMKEAMDLIKQKMGSDPK
ncbi:hypothetical protein BDW22DRAFT_1425124 [Trametopsis cervina]|nr:hypothetical protein BDW22DRAFT_1425124 [Trametopsis cervina]